MGQESDKKAKPYVIEVQKEAEKKEQEQKDKELNWVDDKKRWWKRYQSRLGEILYHKMLGMDWPYYWKFGVDVSEDGIAAQFLTDRKHKYAKGIKPINNLPYDMNAIRILAEQVENTIDKLRTDEIVVPGSILLPDGERHRPTNN